MVHNTSRLGAVVTGPSTESGFDLAWFSCLPSERLCIFGLHGAIFYYSCYILSWVQWCSGGVSGS